MTGAVAKWPWAEAVATFDVIKHNSRAPAQVEKALQNIDVDERVLLLRGSDSDIVDRLSAYDQVEGNAISEWDPSASQCASLMGPVIARYPNSLEELSACLVPRAGQVVPLFARAHQTLCSEPGPAGLTQHVAVAEPTDFAAAVCNLCFYTPQVEGNKGMTFHSVGSYFDFLSIIDDLQSTALHLKLNDNMTEQGSTVSLVQGQARPDLVVTAAMLTVMLCEYEYKQAAVGVHAAYEDLVRKCSGGLPPGHYGPALFIPALCASGHTVQFYAVGMNGQVAAVPGAEFSTARQHDRIMLTMAMANLYQLLGCLVRNALAMHVRRPLFVAQLRNDQATTIQICAGSVVNCIRNFASRPAVPHTTLAMVQWAYAASTTSPGNFLVGAKSAPRLSDNGTYVVKTCPVGYTHIPTQEKASVSAESSSNASPCSVLNDSVSISVRQALHILSAAELVHRDVRMDNILRLQEGHYMLLDLENVATVQKGPFVSAFKEWDHNTLNSQHEYDHLSDMYQLGKLLSTLLRQPRSEAAKDFINNLNRVVVQC